MFSYYDPSLTTMNHHESPVVSVVAMAMSRSRPFPARSTNWWLRRSCLTANFFAAELQLLTPHHWPSPVEKMNQLGSSSQFIICYPFCGTDSFFLKQKEKLNVETVAWDFVVNAALTNKHGEMNRNKASREIPDQNGCLQLGKPSGDPCHLGGIHVGK